MPKRKAEPLNVRIDTDTSGAVTTFNIDGIASGWEQWFLFMSDNHHDSIYCERELELEHLEEARRRNARIFIIGDLFDAMQGRFDPRRSMDELRPEYRRPDYYDFVVKDTTKFFAPYADLLTMVCPGNHECVDELTEVLTRSGWKSIKDVTLDDEVLSIQNWDRIPIFAKPIKTHAYEYNGKMIWIRHKKLDMFMTPNHRMAYIPQKADYIHYRSANDPGSQMEIPISVNLNQPEYPIGDDEIRYAAWILTDGSIRDKAHIIYQSKSKMCSRIKELLDNLKIQYSWKIRQRDTSHIAGRKLLSLPQPENSFSIQKESKEYVNTIVCEKGKLPDWAFQLSKRQFDIFLYELILGDGSVEKRSESARVLYGEKEFLDDVQRACVQNGYRANLSIRHRDGEDSYFALNITEHETIEIKNIKSHSSQEEFNGMVYCLTTVTGNFFARRNGTVYLTGNSAVLKNANTNLTDRLVYELRTKHGSQVIHGGYGGWLRFVLTGRSMRGFIYKLKYFHGAGGEAPVTRGTIQTNRQAVYLPDADIVVNGHSHNAYHVPIARERVSQNGRLYMDIQHHIRIPGYKNAYGNGKSGWEVTRGGVPKPVGAVWMRMWFDYAGTEKERENNGGAVKLQFVPDVRGAQNLVDSTGIYDGKIYDDDREGN